MMSASAIQAQISGLPDHHILKRSSQGYIDQFISALVRVYSRSKLINVLQHRFFVPYKPSYSDDRFYQSAAELSVANHIKQASAGAFGVDKKVNPTNRTDVDDYFEVGATRIALEVKTADVEIDQAIPGDWILRTAGRVPNHAQKIAQMSPALAQASPNKRVVPVQNKDSRLKDFLLSANSKFNPSSGVDDLNVLFVACGYIDDIANWYMHLFAPEGLFTANSFHPPVDFRNVDTVVLSNLKYCHEHCRDCKNPHDWTLRNVFLLPCVNPHARSSMTREALFSGLSIFDHHLTEFLVFESDNTGVPPGFFDAAKALHYLRGFLDRPRKNQYFPVKLARNDY